MESERIFAGEKKYSTNKFHMKNNTQTQYGNSTSPFGAQKKKWKRPSQISDEQQKSHNSIGGNSELKVDKSFQNQQKKSFIYSHKQFSEMNSNVISPEKTTK